MIKVIANTNGRVLGASILGKNAGELITIWILILQKKMKLSDISSVIVPYPTYSDLNKQVANKFYQKVF